MGGYLHNNGLTPDERQAFQQVLACNWQLLEENQALRTELEKTRVK